MKTGLFLTALVQLAAAQPHVNRHAHLHEKRDAVTVYTTATAPGAVIYANQDGAPISTSYVNQPAGTPAPPAPAPPAPAPPAAGKKHHKHHHKSHKHQSHKQPSQENVVTHESASGSKHHSSDGLGIVYSPYNGDGSCKTQDEVNSDFQKIGTGYPLVRIYGTDCDQLDTVGNAAQGMKIFAGVFDLSDVSGDVSMIINAFSKDWSRVDTVSIGNELVNSGSNSAEEVVSALNAARQQLRSAGYNGPVVTVDTFSAVISNPTLCQNSDYPAVNAHAFFDPTVSPPQAGQWVKNTVSQVENACGGGVVVTESGYPHQGSPNGQAIPSPQGQQEALSSIRSAFSSNLILFTAFDDLWKPTDPSTFNAEKYWGFLSGQ